MTDKQIQVLSDSISSLIFNEEKVIVDAILLGLSVKIQDIDLDCMSTLLVQTKGIEGLVYREIFYNSVVEYLSGRLSTVDLNEFLDGLR